MKINILKKTGAAAAALFSIFSIVEGTKVFVGAEQKEYMIFNPLVIYNVFAGMVGLFAGAALWLNYKWALNAARAVLAAHIIVLLIITTFHFSGAAVAVNSVLAMTVRSLVWAVVLFLVSKSDSGDKAQRR